MMVSSEVYYFVIASVAKQTRSFKEGLEIASSQEVLAMTVFA
jgi:hypothetical protein